MVEQSLLGLIIILWTIIITILHSEQLGHFSGDQKPRDRLLEDVIYFTLLPFLGLSFCHSDLFFHWSHFQGGVGNFTVTIDFFKSNAFREAYTTNDYPVFKRLSQNIYIQYSINTSNPDLVVRAETCRATPSNKPYDSPQYVFIADGWVTDRFLE